MCLKAEAAKQACQRAEQAVQQIHQAGDVAQQVRNGTHQVAKRSTRSACNAEPHRVERNIKSEQIHVGSSQTDIQNPSTARALNGYESGGALRPGRPRDAG